MYRKIVKRIIDFIGAVLLLLFFSPVMLVVAIILYYNNHRPVLFKQLRPGLNERIFMLYKFRTMNDNRDRNGNLLPDKVRLTALGKFIRKTSLDELPQLFNVLKGDMSFIGPRPLLVEYLPLYNAEQKKRHDVKPGITGWAQINGRNAISWEKKFELDVWYVKKLSFFMDVKIVLLTIKNVLMAKSINQQGQATMEKFKG